MLQLDYLCPQQAMVINRQPHSRQFDDVFFNDEGGLAESNHVFIEQNNLKHRWRQAADKSQFCIAETGFGTGLNFMAVLQAWQQNQQRPKRLHYISIEKYPLDLNSMQQAHRCFPELQPFSEQLLSSWGNYRTGIQCMNFDQGVTLMLILGDATDCLGQLHAQVDAWFLDGFAPSKNPEMWQTELFAEINRLSKSGTTLATFTAASAVRKKLTKQGFKVNKKTGFGKKREMITAHHEQAIHNNESVHDWSPLPAAKITQPKVSILGAGIAGMCLAAQFKQAGFATTIIDQHPDPMQVTSGNALAMMMPLLTAQDSPESLFYVRAFDAAKRFYQSGEFHAIGVQQHLSADKQHKWHQNLAKAGYPDSLLSVQSGHVTYPSAGYIDTKQVAQRLKGNVDHWLKTQVTGIKPTAAGGWQLCDTTDNVIHQCELLVVANGMGAKGLLKSADLSLVGKHGQTSSVIPPDDAELSQVLLQSGYVIPHHSKKLWLCGATFDHVTEQALKQPAELHPDHWDRNRKMWQNHPISQSLIRAKVLHGHAGIRATTPDHLPICGPLIDQRQFQDDHKDLHHGRHWQTYPPAKPLNNLYVLNGLGSRGFTSAPLLAQYLTAMILAEPLPLEADLCKIIHPNRFLYRKLKKPPQR